MTTPFKSPYVPRLAAATVLALGGAPLTTLHAGESYGSVGFPGVMAGYAHHLDDQVVVRADYAALRSRQMDGNEDGIKYKGTAKFRRVGLFADYFPTGNGLRVTGGLTFNHMKVDLNSDFSSGGSLDVGNANYVLPAGAYFNVRIKMPPVTPYVGVGWGHQGKRAGWGLLVDLGVSIGRAKVSVDTNLASMGVSQSDIDMETKQVRNGIGAIRVMPQATIGISYKY